MLGVAHVQRPEHALQAIVGGRHGNQVDVVAHQAISQHLNLVLVCILLEPRKIREAVIIAKKDRRAPIAALRYMMRQTGKYGSG
jgi:hypothetical protein